MLKMKILSFSLLFMTLLLQLPNFVVVATETVSEAEQAVSETNPLPALESGSDTNDEIQDDQNTTVEVSDLEDLTENPEVDSVSGYQGGQEQVISILEVLCDKLDFFFGQMGFWFVAVAAWCFSKKSWKGVD